MNTDLSGVLHIVGTKVAWGDGAATIVGLYLSPKTNRLVAVIKNAAGMLIEEQLTHLVVREVSGPNEKSNQTGHPKTPSPVTPPRTDGQSPVPGNLRYNSTPTPGDTGILPPR